MSDEHHDKIKGGKRGKEKGREEIMRTTRKLGEQNVRSESWLFVNG